MSVWMCVNGNIKRCMVNYLILHTIVENYNVPIHSDFIVGCDHAHESLHNGIFSIQFIIFFVFSFTLYLIKLYLFYVALSCILTNL